MRVCVIEISKFKKNTRNILLTTFNNFNSKFCSSSAYANVRLIQISKTIECVYRY